ncbi:hypothetical protein LTR84_007793 [Exophiala bonariae]|uniref:BTB domain-containing protein n=1 Tax=Exophiala bonariae TaxID=1690606 RepID=A0AAV9NL28_9EURO|nr:hypothetical protein LTR84_007793 [Exophiala bonariae]
MARRILPSDSRTANSRLRQFESDLFFPQASGDVSIIDDDDDIDIPPRSDITASASKKRKAPTSMFPEPLTPTPTSPIDSRGVIINRGPRIKSEEETNAFKALAARPADERVKIFVGSINHEFTVGIDTLDKSPVLQTLLIRDRTGEESYIMHPLLTKVNTKHFEAVVSFLVMDEYDPFIISNPNGADSLPKRLDGVVSTEDYRKEALRSCSIYVIAKQLNMASLEKLVLRKIIEAQYRPYGIQCLLEMSRIVFSRKDNAGIVKMGKMAEPPGQSHDEDTGAEGEGDKLEEWLIGNLTEKLQAVLLTNAQLFFQVANLVECQKRGFAIRIFRTKVEAWEHDGPNVVAIDDDE